jgi:hypothetical protein
LDFFSGKDYSETLENLEITTSERGEFKHGLDEVRLKARPDPPRGDDERRRVLDRREAVGVGIIEEPVGSPLVGGRHALDRLAEESVEIDRPRTLQRVSAMRQSKAGSKRLATPRTRH